jgi:hypothetical protein
VTLRGRKEDQATRFVFRTDNHRLVFFGVTAVCIALVSIANSHKSSTFWYVLTLYVLVWAVALMWLASHRITIDQEMLSYSTLGKAEIVINRADILRVDIPLGRFKNVIKIERLQGDPILINAKPFSESDLRIVFEFLSNNIEGKPNRVRFALPRE